MADWEQLNEQQKIDVLNRQYQSLRKLGVTQLKKLGSISNTETEEVPEEYWVRRMLVFYWKYADAYIEMQSLVLRDRLSSFSRFFIEARLKIHSFLQMTLEERRIVAVHDMLRGCVMHFREAQSSGDTKQAADFKRSYDKIRTLSKTDVPDIEKVSYRKGHLKTFPKVEQMADRVQDNSASQYFMYRACSGPLHASIADLEVQEQGNGYIHGYQTLITNCLRLLNEIERVYGTGLLNELNDLKIAFKKQLDSVTIDNNPIH